MHGTTAYDPAISSNVLIQMQPVQYILQVRFNTDTMSNWDWTTALLMTNTAAGSQRFHLWNLKHPSCQAPASF